MDSPYTSVFPSENEDNVAYSEGCAGCQVVAKLAAPSPLHLGLVRLLSGLLTDTADLCRIRPVLCATVLNLLASPAGSGATGSAVSQLPPWGGDYIGPCYPSWLPWGFCPSWVQIF